MIQKKAIQRKERLEYFAKKRIEFIRNIENSAKPFWVFLAIFCLAIINRFIIEVSLSSYAPTFFDLPAFLQLAFFFISTALTAILLLHFFVDENITKISKVVLPVFSIIISPPIIDFIFSGGKGFSLAYLSLDKNILYTFLTMGGIELDSGATIGIRIEITIFLILFLYYLQLKKPGLIRNLAKTFVFYCAIFLYMASASFFEPILNYFELDICLFGVYLMYPFFLILITIQLAIISFIYDKRIFKLVLLDSRPERIFHFVSMFAIGILLSLTQFNNSLGIGFWISLIFTPLAIIFSWLFSVLQNNIQDYKIDLISNKNRPLQRKIDKQHYIVFSYFFLFLALSFAIAAGTLTFGAIILFILSYFVYSNPPFRLKKVIVFSKLLISFPSLVLLITGFVIGGGSIQTFPSSIAILFMIGFTLAINFIDIKDYLGDKKEKINTLPVILGLKKSKFIISLFFILTYLLTFFVVPKIDLIPWLILFSIIEFVLINQKNYYEKPVFITYLISLIVIIIFYLI